MEQRVSRDGRGGHRVRAEMLVSRSGVVVERRAFSGQFFQVAELA